MVINLTQLYFHIIEPKASLMSHAWVRGDLLFHHVLWKKWPIAQYFECHRCLACLLCDQSLDSNSAEAIWLSWYLDLRSLRLDWFTADSLYQLLQHQFHSRFQPPTALYALRCLISRFPFHFRVLTQAVLEYVFAGTKAVCIHSNFKVFDVAC